MTFPRIQSAGRDSFPLRVPLAVRLALRDLRGGLRGFWIFLFCIALGTAAIGTIRTLSQAIQDAIERDGKILLGGDAEATLVHQRASGDAFALLKSFGSISEAATMRAMARSSDGSRQALVDLKAVDASYPLYGTLSFKAGTLETLRTKQGVAVDETLLAQLGLAVGDSLLLGNGTFPVAAILDQEPDKLAGGPAFGARVLLPLEALDRTGLIEPGSLVRWHYRIKAAKARAQDFRSRLTVKFPEAGFLVRDSSDPSPGIKSTLGRLTEFLTLAGLTAMLTGGIGVANAVAGFVERRRATIATFKALGASHGLIFEVLFIEVALLSVAGVVLGFALTGVLPLLLAKALNTLLPIEINPGLRLSALVLAGIFGLLTALPFMLWPLGRARDVKPAELFRQGTDDSARYPPLAYCIASLAALAVVVACVIAFAQDKRVAAIACVALLAVFAFFWAFGAVVKALCARVPRLRWPEAALAFNNLGGPASAAQTVVLSLGTGLTLLTAISLIDASLSTELKSRLPEHAPSYFFIGIPKQDVNAFTQLLAKNAPGSKISTAPMLRGRIVSLRGVAVEQLKVPSSAEWVLNGDRGITYSEPVSSGSQVVEGAWWPKDYGGEPLVSFEAELAKALNLHVGDAVTVNVLGRNLTAKVANLRKVAWATMDINFVMIFSPNALKNAPFTFLATLSATEGGAESGSAVIQAVAKTYPAVSAIRVREALSSISGVFEKVALAVRAAASVTLIMGVLVIAGALIAAQRRRVYQAAILRSLGASKRRIAGAHLMEYLLLAAAVCAAALLLGAVFAYGVLVYIMDVSFILSLKALLQPSALETIFIIGLGLAGTLKVLASKPGHYLRSE